MALATFGNMSDRLLAEMCGVSANDADAGLIAFWRIVSGNSVQRLCDRISDRNRLGQGKNVRHLLVQAVEDASRKA
jgi:hypothetical protein